MTSKTITFSVRITYEHNEDGVICEESATENLFEAIENERNNGCLTPCSFSAQHTSVEFMSVQANDDKPKIRELFEKADSILINQKLRGETSTFKNNKGIEFTVEFTNGDILTNKFEFSTAALNNATSALGIWTIECPNNGKVDIEFFKISPM
jgi:hypothetical protein